MGDAKRILLGILLWVGAITALHLVFNVDWSVFLNDWLPEGKRKIYTAYIPVT